jgi:hypothetical protein
MSDDLFDDFVMPTDNERDGYVVEDDRHANRMVRRLANLRADIRRIHEDAAYEVQRIHRLRDDRIAGADRDADFLEGLLKSYLARLIGLRPKGPKSLKLLGAEISASSTGGLKAVHVRDREEYLPWAIEHEMHDPGSPVPVEFESLVLIEGFLRELALIFNGDGAQDSPRANVAVLLADRLARLMDEHVKLRVPSGLKLVEEEGQDPKLADPNTGEIVPGLAVSPQGYNYRVKLEGEAGNGG